MKFELAACAGYRACAVVRGKLRAIYGGVGTPVVLTLDLPGCPVAVHPEGPTVLCDDGRVFTWNQAHQKWDSAGNLSAEGK